MVAVEVRVAGTTHTHTHAVPTAPSIFGTLDDSDCFRRPREKARGGEEGGGSRKRRGGIPRPASQSGNLVSLSLSSQAHITHHSLTLSLSHVCSSGFLGLGREEDREQGTYPHILELAVR